MKATIFLAGGCFWGMQAYFDQVKGVLETTVGYANGTTAFPRYEEVKTGKTGHAETLRIVYDDEVTSLEKLLELYLRAVDPYSVNRQGEDEGSQYRTGIYYTDLLDGIRARTYLNAHLNPGYAIEIRQMNNFFPAEEYHQQYLKKNPGGYCHIRLSSLKPEEKK